jgi:hypothetical protein
MTQRNEVAVLDEFVCIVERHIPWTFSPVSSAIPVCPARDVSCRALPFFIVGDGLGGSLRGATRVSEGSWPPSPSVGAAPMVMNVHNSGLL